MKDTDIYLLANQLGYDPSDISPLKLEASGRVYYRLHLKNDETVILCYLDPLYGDQISFVHTSEYLAKSGILCPRVLNHDGKIGVTIQQDIGDTSLIDIDIEKDNGGLLLGETIRLLSKLHLAQIPQLPTLTLNDLSAQMQMMEEMFLNNFLDITLSSQLSDIEQQALENLSQQPWMNCHFDFERRNLHAIKNDICVIDFQDLCHGPIGIDLAGIFIDHYKTYPKEIILKQLKRYNEYMTLDVHALDTFEWLRWGGIQRGMRILGTLSKLYIETKRSFRLKDLSQILDNFINLIPEENHTCKTLLIEKVSPALRKRMNEL